jgi:hypothetical protein
MSGARKAGLVVGVVALVGALRCYSPDPPSGTLMCSSDPSHLCPEGYNCRGSYCYKNGDVDAGTGVAGATGAAGAAGTGGHAGTGGAGGGTAGTGVAGAAGTTAGSEKFVGHWLFDAGSTEHVACTDGSSKDNDLSTDFVDVLLNADGQTLTASYFCSWKLAIGPMGDSTVLKPVTGQSCSRSVMDATTGTTMFTWTASTFALRTLDGKAASLSSMIGVNYVDDATKTGCIGAACMGTCSIRITGTLTKSP